MKKYFEFPTILAIGAVALAFMCGYLFLKVQALSNPSNTLKTTGNITTPSPAPTVSPEELKEEVVRLVNNERTLKGLKPLKENQLLNKSAQLKLDDMVEKGYFAHISPEGLSPWYFFEKAGYHYGYAGENLANNMASVESTVVAWMNSPIHKEDILNPNYKDTGVAVANEPFSTLFIVQHFGSLRKVYTTTTNQTPSRTGNIISYHDWCNNKDTSVYENEIITKKSSD